MGQAVVHFEVVGKDHEKLRQYFGELFGWEYEDSPADAYKLVPLYKGADGVGIRGAVGGAPEGSEGHVRFYVDVPDVERALADADRLGGARRMGPMDVPGVGISIGQFTDPEGHLIGLVGPAAQSS